MSQERLHEKRSQEFVEIHFSETLGYSLFVSALGSGFHPDSLSDSC